MHLVPFGEYVPLKSLLFFVGPIVEAVSAFSPGRDPVLLPVGSHRISTAICYEVIFPSLIRRFVLDGSELLTTITNDAWYGRSSAAYQHWEQAAMRSIEQGRYLARAANTGISGFVDPYGRVLQKTDLFHPAVLVADLRFIQSRRFTAASAISSPGCPWPSSSSRSRSSGVSRCTKTRYSHSDQQLTASFSMQR